MGHRPAMSIPVLITTALAPPPGVPHLRMNDVARRTVATRGCVHFWAAQRVERIVIADATGGVCLHDEDVALLARTGCVVEQISYRQDDDAVRARGKGYAEGQLIAFALESSRLLAQSERFFKCTGKLLCRNFSQIAAMVEHNGLTELFWMGSYSGVDFANVDARLFLATRAFFADRVMEGYARASDAGGPMVEAALTEAIAPSLLRASFPRPRLSGFSGGYDSQYPDVTLGDLDSAFPCLIGRNPGGV